MLGQWKPSLHVTSGFEEKITSNTIRNILWFPSQKKKTTLKVLSLSLSVGQLQSFPERHPLT